ncbi:hypothetical protein BCR34DRAFT_249856 [Clohesyomyces aquaticus]|uniref:Uncharacterized protein n=1 Tax=Clohesyomyces aquaticus TaxID=1231657 RepID=A0A1Y1ZUR7_9PLEO|nr:hypothetical protein BCR34DRAFT_249856 [Clohesyomyces aquaticus]
MVVLRGASFRPSTTQAAVWKDKAGTRDQWGAEKAKMTPRNLSHLLSARQRRLQSLTEVKLSSEILAVPGETDMPRTNCWRWSDASFHLGDLVRKPRCQRYVEPANLRSLSECSPAPMSIAGWDKPRPANVVIPGRRTPPSTPAFIVESLAVINCLGSCCSDASVNVRRTTT